MRTVLSLAVLLVPGLVHAQVPEYRINPAIRDIFEAVSEEHISATLRKLESFGTRHVMSGESDPGHGINAARDWIADQFRSYSSRLEVRRPRCDSARRRTRERRRGSARRRR